MLTTKLSIIDIYFNKKKQIEKYNIASRSIGLSLGFQRECVAFVTF